MNKRLERDGFSGHGTVSGDSANRIAMFRYVSCCRGNRLSRVGGNPDFGIAVIARDAGSGPA